MLARDGRRRSLVVVAELQVALKPRRGVLGSSALHTVRQQQDDACLDEPLGLARAEELVDDALRRVGEVSELRLPQHEGVRGVERLTPRAASCAPQRSHHPRRRRRRRRHRCHRLPPAPPAGSKPRRRAGHVPPRGAVRRYLARHPGRKGARSRRRRAAPRRRGPRPSPNRHGAARPVRAWRPAAHRCGAPG
eukprot:scaffold41125_cov53-Phaeocystis_antarctica.AAC.5